MPKYTVTHPETGRKITLTGTAPPSEAELDDIFAQTAGDAPGRTPSYDNRVTDKAEIERRRREFVANDGTLETRIRNTSVGQAAKNALLEVPRLAQEVVTVPLSSAKKGIYGIGALAKTSGELARGSDLDTALRAGSQVMEGYTPIHGPLAPSMTGELIGTGIEKGINAAESATGNTGWAGAGIQAGADILGLVGGGKVLAKAGKKGVSTLRDLREGTRPAQTELQALSREHGVPLTAGEELSSPNMKQVEARLERLPLLGIRGFRKKQGEALAESATRLADEFATVAEDPATALVDRFKSNLKKAKEESSEAYGKIDEALAANGDAGAIEPTATRSQVQSLLSKSPDIFDRLPGAQNEIKGILGKILNSTKPKYQPSVSGSAAKSLVQPPAIDPITRQPIYAADVPISRVSDFSTTEGLVGKLKGNAATAPAGRSPSLDLDVALGVKPQAPRTLTYEEYTVLRGKLGEYIDRAHSAAGAVGSNELRQLTIIKKALDADFYRWGKNSGYENVTAAVDNARNVYKTKVAPFENVPVLKSIVNDKFTPEQLLDAIAKPGQATLATRAMKGMKESDKALVQDAIMRRALAFGFEGGKDGAPMSAAKFASFIEKMDTRTKNASRSPMDVFFSPAEKQRVIGFAKLARAAERSSQYSANPLTGVAAADLAIPGAIGTVAGTVGAPAAMSAAAVTKAMSLMLTTPQGKALLHRAYRTPAGATAAWSAILNQASQMRDFAAKKGRDQRGLVGKDIDDKQKTVYHATNGDFDTFDFTRLGEFTRKNTGQHEAGVMAELGVWSNESPISKKTGQAKDIPLNIALTNPLKTTFENLWKRAAKYKNGQALRDDLIKKGYDGLVVKDSEFGGLSYVAFRPDQIKKVK